VLISYDETVIFDAEKAKNPYEHCLGPTSFAIVFDIDPFDCCGRVLWGRLLAEAHL